MDAPTPENVDACTSTSTTAEPALLGVIRMMGYRSGTTRTAFAKAWDGRFPTISKLWQRHWTNLSAFFSYPEPLRKVIYTTNAIESINAQLRKVTKKKGAFPTKESVQKVLYLALARASERWKRPIRDWAAALNHLSIVFDGRVPE